MNKRAGPLAEILLEIDEFLLTRMKISIINSHKWAGLHGCGNESSKMRPRAIFKKNIKTVLY